MAETETETETVVETPRTTARKVTRKGRRKANGAGKKVARSATRKAVKQATSKARKVIAPRLGVDAFGFRKGSIKSRAAAMYASKRGATKLQVEDKLNSTQLNLLTELEGKGFKINRLKEDGPGKRQVTRYFLKAK